MAAGGSAKRSSGAEWEEDAADRDDSAWRAVAWLPAAVRERIVAAVGSCGRGGVGGGGGEVIGRGVAAMERRRGFADSDLGAQLEPARELGFSVESIRVECLGVDDDRISLRMPLPGRAVLLLWSGVHAPIFVLTKLHGRSPERVSYESPNYEIVCLTL